MIAHMNIQSWVVFLAVGWALWIVLRSLLKGPSAKSCASGCGACASRTCALRRLEAAQKKGH